MSLWLIADLVDSLMEAISEFFGEIFYKLVIGLCSAIYSVVYYLYQIFLALANVSVFDGKIFDTLTSKIYLVLGIITIFALAYNLINLIIDPSKEKGSKQVLDTIKKIVTSFIIIVLCPTIFAFSVDLQNAILSRNFIGKLLSTSETVENDMKYQVADLSRTFFRGFFYSVNSNDDIKNQTSYYSKSAEYIDNNGKPKKVEAKCGSKGGCSLKGVDKYVNASGDFYMYKAFALNTYHNQIEFSWFIGAIVGCYICYILISFCIDVAIRQIKLIFYQLLAPICIACRTIPNEDKVFKNWLSAVFKTYMSVFIRIILLSLSILLITLINQNWDTITKQSVCDYIICSTGVKFFTKLFLILACITFLKQGSKMICELFGFDDVKIKMNGKLKDGGAYMAGSALSTGITNASRKGYQEFSQIKKGNGWKNNLGHLAKGIAGAGTGFASGAVTGGRNAANVDSFKGMNDATVKSMDEITKKRNRAIENKSNNNTPLRRAGRWFTGNTDNASANDTIVNMINGITDHAKSKIEGDAKNNKKYTYGVDRAFGSFSDDKLKDSSGHAMNIGYSLKEEKEMLDARDAAKASRGPVSYKGITLNLDDFEKILAKYQNGLKGSESIYRDANGKPIFDYSTEVVHKMDQLLEQARRTGSKENISMTDSLGNSISLNPEEFADFRNKYVKAFSEAIASAAAQTPEGHDAFIKSVPKDASGKTIDDGSEMLADLYREGLELRTTLTNNQTAEIVKVLRELHADKGFKDDTVFKTQLQSGQLKFFKDEFLGEIKRANNKVLDEVSEKRYKSNSIGQKKDN